MFGCIAMVVYFKESTKMEAAFGLSVTLTMLMSTLLINAYLRSRRVKTIYNLIITVVFLTIELSFLIANLQKIKEGGWITLLIGISLIVMMLIWWKGREIKTSLQKFVSIDKYAPLLKKLSLDESVNKYATNLVYLTSSNSIHVIEQTIINSILNNGLPKRADVYWFIHVNILDEPYAQKYQVNTIIKNDIYFIQFDLGFREEPRIGYYFKQVVNDMIAKNEVDIAECSDLIYNENKVGDFKFILMDSLLSYDNKMSILKNFIMKSYYNLRHLSVKDYVNYGLDKSNLLIETYPLVIDQFIPIRLERKS